MPPKPEIDAEWAWELRQQGYGATEVARIMGRSRQAVHHRLTLLAEERGETVPGLQTKFRRPISAPTPPRRRGRESKGKPMTEKQALQILRRMGVDR